MKKTYILADRPKPKQLSGLSMATTDPDCFQKTWRDARSTNKFCCHSCGNKGKLVPHERYVFDYYKSKHIIVARIIELTALCYHCSAFINAEKMVNECVRGRFDLRLAWDVFKKGFASLNVNNYHAISWSLQLRKLYPSLAPEWSEKMLDIKMPIVREIQIPWRSWYLIDTSGVLHQAIFTSRHDWALYYGYI